jgi:hypothetical protein
MHQSAVHLLQLAKLARIVPKYMGERRVVTLEPHRELLRMRRSSLRPFATCVRLAEASASREEQ